MCTFTYIYVIRCVYVCFLKQVPVFCLVFVFGVFIKRSAATRYTHTVEPIINIYIFWDIFPLSENCVICCCKTVFFLLLLPLLFLLFCYCYYCHSVIIVNQFEYGVLLKRNSFSCKRIIYWIRVQVHTSIHRRAYIYKRTPHTSAQTRESLFFTVYKYSRKLESSINL